MIDAPTKDLTVKESSQGGIPARTFAQDYPLSILIADDNFVNQKLMERILCKLGYLTDTAADGLQVLLLMEKKIYNLILMDVRMPEMDGYETTQAIRQMTIAQPYIIAMTANVSANDQKECTQAGMNNFSPKPFNMSEITTKLKIASEFCSNKDKNANADPW